MGETLYRQTSEVLKLISWRLPLAIITVLHSVSVPMLPPTTSWSPGQCQLSVNQYQQVGIKLVTLQSDKSHLFKWLFKKNGFLAVSESDLGFELLKSSQRQNSSLTCHSTSFYLPCINSQAVIRTISWNRWKSSLSCIWTGQDFCSLLTGSLSDLTFSVSAYGMWKEGQECSGLSRACLLPVACQDGHPKDWPTLSKMFS